jgi:hypothetical protein
MIGYHDASNVATKPCPLGRLSRFGGIRQPAATNDEGSIAVTGHGRSFLLNDQLPINIEA